MGPAHTCVLAGYHDALPRVPLCPHLRCIYVLYIPFHCVRCRPVRGGGRREEEEEEEEEEEAGVGPEGSSIHLVGSLEVDRADVRTRCQGLDKGEIA